MCLAKRWAYLESHEPEEPCDHCDVEAVSGQLDHHHLDDVGSTIPDEECDNLEEEVPLLVRLDFGLPHVFLSGLLHLDIFFGLLEPNQS